MQFMIDMLPSRVFEHIFRKKPQKENNNDNSLALVEEELLSLALPYHIGTSIDTPLPPKQHNPTVAVLSEGEQMSSSV